MQIPLPLYPDGIDPDLLNALKIAAKQSENWELSPLLQRVHNHVEKARSLRVQNPMVHVRLAEAIAQVYSAVHDRWEQIPEVAHPWLKGAMFYFTEADDDDPDFSSPIGFEDDVEVLNACLHMAGLKELCMNPADFDS